jgi:hypothetical protein
MSVLVLEMPKSVRNIIKIEQIMYFLPQIIHVLCFFNLPEKYPKEFGNLFHALDVWHKSIKLSKKLAKVFDSYLCVS